MKRWLLALGLVLVTAHAAAQGRARPAVPAASAPASTAVDAALKELPQGRGLPVVVRAGLTYMEVKEISENDGAFTATIDMRVRWQDQRLAWRAGETGPGYKEFNDTLAEQELTRIWHPNVEFANLKGEPMYQKRGLRIDPLGNVELMQRTTAVFTADFSLENFPFDRQKLTVEMVSRQEPLQRLLLDFRQDELEFSNTSHRGGVEGWTLGLVEMAKGSVEAWRGEENPQLKASRVVKRDQKSLLATIFVPLFASLLIPLLVLWLNKMEDGEFTIDAFELTNISIGGLFAVVALNFTVNSSFVKLATGDNPVMRLFGLNYFLLAFSIAVGILLYRFNVVKRLFGPHMAEEFFVYLNWAVPVLVFGTAAAMLGMALF